MSLPSVVPDLDVLERSGLVRSETVGRVRACRLEPGSMRALDGTRLVEAAPGERRAPPARLAAW